MPEERTAPLGELISALDEHAAWNQRRVEAESKITKAPETGTLSGFYAIRSTEYYSHAQECWARVKVIRGFDRLRAICEAEGAGITSRQLRQFRGQFCVEQEVTIEAADAMSAEDFARAVLLMYRGNRPNSRSPVKLENPTLFVSSWTELAIGLRADWTYWGTIPAPALGAIFPLSKAFRLNLAGDRWKKVLEVIAAADDPQIIAKDHLVSALNALPAAQQAVRDGRARPRAVEAALRDELPATEHPASKLLGNTLSDLRRELRKYVDGPKGKHDCCLAIEGNIVRPGFIARCLLEDASGEKKFGQRRRA